VNYKKNAGLADAFHKMETGLTIDKVGNGGYDLAQTSLKPLGKPQSPAQHASVKKAALASAASRKAKAGLI
jgi:hypothetical protein